MESLSESYISKLNEYKQKTGSTVQFEEGSTEGPSHNKTFTCTAVVNGTRYADATGKSKKEAKQNAARIAYTAIAPTLNTQTTTSTQSISNNMGIARQSYTCWLNEFSQKSKLGFKVRESNKMDPGSLSYTYVCKYVCGDKEYPEAYGKTKKEAKEAAAKCVYEELHPAQNTEDFNENCNNTPRSEVASLSANLDRLSCADDSRSATPDNNYIAHLNEYCQKQECVLDFKFVEKRGPPHNPEFVYKAVIDGKEFSEGHGKSSKAEAKQSAAQSAWNELQQASDGSTQGSEEDTSSQTSEILKSGEVHHPPHSSSADCSDSVVFKDSASVNSPMAISPALSPMDSKSKIRLAPTFNILPNGTPKIKRGGSNMNINNQIKPSSDQTVNQAIKSRFLEDFDSIVRIGKGAFGRVFKARRKLENKYYAVKIVKSKNKAYREVNALAALHHPNIIRYYSAWVEDTQYKHDFSESNSTSDSGSSPETKFLYIQMELCEGNTLRVWIDERNSLNGEDTERRRDAEHLCSQILQAVQHIHSKDLIHRDLKPANIMFGSEGGVKVGDFGLVTAAENDDDEQLLQRTRKTGTRSYMSPEQVTQSYDKKVDIFALGLIYFELLWNFVTVSEKSQIWNDVKRRNFPPQFSEKFDFEHKLIHKMLHDKPKHRPDASQLIRELRQCSTVLKSN